jgi:DNA repair exonuclease SbcCD ATPase subunit
VALAVALIAIAAVAYAQFSGKSALEERLAALEGQLQENVTRLDQNTTSLASDLDVVTKRIGVTDQELNSARRFAEKLRVEQEEARAKLAEELATKASASEVTNVANNVALAREETATKVAEVQRQADSRITSVSGDVKTVASNLEATRQDLAASRRELGDVRSSLSEQIARNAGELAALRLKGERNYTEFDIKKGKKNEMTRVSDIRIELRETDVKKQKYNVVVQIDDNKYEKKDRLANEPVEFLVGREKLRYEIVVNIVDKDRIRGYVSAPKDRTLSAEGPAPRD